MDRCVDRRVKRFSGNLRDRQIQNPLDAHHPPEDGVVLDAFCGSGTTLAVATGHGRDAIGIDLDERNADLARERLGMFITINGATT